MIFDPPHLGDSQEEKMSRLLGFYEKRLSEEQRTALALLALFRAPVGEAQLQGVTDSDRS